LALQGHVNVCSSKSIEVPSDGATPCQTQEAADVLRRRPSFETFVEPSEFKPQQAGIPVTAQLP
jgi:hypothetical protein